MQNRFWVRTTAAPDCSIRAYILMRFCYRDPILVPKCDILAFGAPRMVTFLRRRMAFFFKDLAKFSGLDTRDDITVEQLPQLIFADEAHRR